MINNLSNASNVDALNTNNISKSLVILLSIISCSNAMQLTDVLKPHDINHVKLLHNKNDFFIDNSEVVLKIERCDVDKEIRGIDTAKLAKMMAAGHYLTVNKYQNTDEYNVRLKGRLNGGGPMAGEVFYWATKGIIYETVVLGVKKLMGESTGEISSEVIYDGEDVYVRTLGKIVEKNMDAEEAKQAVIAGGTLWGAKSLAIIESTANYARLVGNVIPWLP